MKKSAPPTPVRLPRTSVSLKTFTCSVLWTTPSWKVLHSSCPTVKKSVPFTVRISGIMSTTTSWKDVPLTAAGLAWAESGAYTNTVPLLVPSLLQIAARCEVVTEAVLITPSPVLPGSVSEFSSTAKMALNAGSASTAVTTVSAVVTPGFIRMVRVRVSGSKAAEALSPLIVPSPRTLIRMPLAADPSAFAVKRTSLFGPGASMVAVAFAGSEPPSMVPSVTKTSPVPSLPETSEML